MKPGTFPDPEWIAPHTREHACSVFVFRETLIQGEGVSEDSPPTFIDLLCCLEI